MIRALGSVFFALRGFGFILRVVAFSAQGVLLDMAQVAGVGLREEATVVRVGPILIDLAVLCHLGTFWIVCCQPPLRSSPTSDAGRLSCFTCGSCTPVPPCFRVLFVLILVPLDVARSLLVDFSTCSH
jgi:hypothetical protein